MNPSFISLEAIQIATPCRADWNAMQPVRGNDCARFCPSCGKNVYNLSGMTREEAERLVGGGDLCVRLRRRSDGTVLTSDCPVGQATSLKRRNWVVQIAATAIGFVTALLGMRGGIGSSRTRRGINGRDNDFYSDSAADFTVSKCSIWKW